MLASQAGEQPAPIALSKSIGTFRISGSPVDFAKNPDLAAASASGAFKGSGHLAMDMRLVRMHTNSPIPYAFSLEGVETKGVQSFAASASGAVQHDSSPFYISMPLESGAVDVTILDSSSLNTNSSWIARYPGWTTDNIGEGIISLRNGVSAVQMGHPIVEILNASNMQIGAPLLQPSMETGMFMIQDEAVEMAKQECKTGMVDVVGMRNLNDLKIRAVPAYGKPDPEVEELYNGLHTNRIPSGGMRKDHVDAFKSLSKEQLASPHLTLEGLPSSLRTPAGKLSWLSEKRDFHLQVGIATRATGSV